MMSFYWQGRFSEKPSDIFKRYYADAMRHHRFMESPARLGQLRLSLERKNELVPKESVRGLVKAARPDGARTHSKCSNEAMECRAWGEEYMRQHCDEGVSGWLHLGRSSPSLRVVASRIAFRKHLLGIMSSTNDMRATLINVAERHTETLMPGYAYPTTH
jgi:argininosuccinate lyase